MQKKIKMKSLYIFLMLAFIALTSILLNVNHGQAYNFSIQDASIYNTSFISATYLDADSDGYADDTRFLLNMYFNPTYFNIGNVRIDCYFEIILPSLTVYSYRGYLIMYPVTSILQFDVFNTVSESGWYVINFSSYARLQTIRYYSFCTITFDPPTGHGEGGGTPTIDM